MCATIAAMAVQITRTQIATPMARAISDVVSSLTFMISPSVRSVAVFQTVQPDSEDSDTSNPADSGCSSATGGRGEAGHPAQNPWCAPGHYLHGAVRAAHRGPTARGGH
jgi:hypothetical protein